MDTSGGHLLQRCRLLFSGRPGAARSRAVRLVALACLGPLLVALAACARTPPPSPGVIRTERLRPPFNIEARRALFGQEIGQFTCPKPTPAVKDVLVDGFYADKDSSIVSPEAMARYQETLKPISVYETQITALSDTFVRGLPASPAAARCVLDWLEAWAGENALLGRVTHQGGYERKWALCAIASSYVKIRDEAGLDASKRWRVEAWIGRLAAEVRGYYTLRTSMDTHNNHVYWAGLGVTLSGVGLNDKGLFGWGVEKYRGALTQIQEDGTLPLELLRKSKARHYHNFSLMPLVLIAEAAAQNGIALYPEGNGALYRLAGRVIEGLDDPGYFERGVGVKQDWVGTLDGGSLVWAEPYFARFADRRLVKWLARFRPLRNRWFGGDATLGYGVKNL